MLIKVCGINSHENVEDTLSLGLDYIGFIFHAGSPRNLTLDPVLIKNYKSTGCKKTGVFVDAGFEEIMQQVSRYDLQVVQLHGNESNAICKKLQEQDIEVIKAFSVNSHFKFIQVNSYPDIDYVLFDTKGKDKGGNGTKFDWSLLDKYQGEKPFILSGGIDANNASELVSTFCKYDKMAGIDINSRFEIEPGKKDMKLIESFIKEIRNGLSN